VSGNQAVVQLRLPRDVYLKARSPELRDLRLFDPAGTSLPFALIGQEQESQAKQAALPVVVFPVFAEAPGARGLPGGLQIRTSEDGSVISVTARKGADAQARTDAVSSLILDLRPPQSRNAPLIGAPVSALTLALPSGVHNYSARIAIEASEDLQRWEVLGDAAVSWLVNDSGDSVRKDRIEFSPTRFRYARISWLDGSPLQFASVTADHAQQTAAVQQWETLVLPPQPGRFVHDLVYQVPIAIPVEALGFEPGDGNVVLPVLIGQYVELPSKSLAQKTVREFVPVARTTFFQLNQNGERRVSPDVMVAPTHAAQWVMRFQNQPVGHPRLRVSWKGATMVFVAAGKGPYTLAFGRDKARTAQVDIGQVAPGFSRRELAQLERAQPGAVVQQGSTEAAANATGLAFSVHRRMIMLWTLLLGGVAALGFMAWRLVGQMKGEPPEIPPGS
jgi:hypothetical protein